MRFGRKASAYRPTTPPNSLTAAMATPYAPANSVESSASAPAESAAGSASRSAVASAAAGDVFPGPRGGDSLEKLSGWLAELVPQPMGLAHRPPSRPQPLELRLQLSATVLDAIAALGCRHAAGLRLPQVRWSRPKCAVGSWSDESTPIVSCGLRRELRSITRLAAPSVEGRVEMSSASPWSFSSW